MFGSDASRGRIRRAAIALTALGLVVAVSVSAAPSRRADLAVAKVTLGAAAVEPGGTVTVRDVTRNRGKAAGGRSTTAYLLSRDARRDRADIRLGQRRVAGLRPRRASTGSARVTIPPAAAPGAYRVIACADDRRRVREGNERNNCRNTAQLQIAAPPPPPPPPPPADPPTPPTVEHQLAVAALGMGSGTVTSAPAGIDCGSDCAETYVAGTSVALTATPAAGSKFVGWSGACSGTAACTVEMSAVRNVTATFAITRHPLTVARTGAGSVTSAPAGIDCASDCAETYDHGTAVTLTAVVPDGSSFTGWGGACAGAVAAPTCTVTMAEARSVTAAFAPVYRLSAARSGEGSISSSPAGISCPDECEHHYEAGTAVTLTAQPATGWTFSGFSGCETRPSVNQCGVVMNGDRAPTAIFDAPTLRLTSVGNDVSGQVTSSPAGMTCAISVEWGGDCARKFGKGASVTLTPTTSNSNAAFVWDSDSAACPGKSGPCVVTMPSTIKTLLVSGRFVFSSAK